MTGRQYLIRLLDVCRRLFYKNGGPVRRLLDATGLNQPISDVYYRLLYYVSDDELQVEVADARAKFRISNYSESNQFHGNLRLERPMLKDLLETVEPEDIVFDIGANVGLYSCLVGDQLNSGHVVAFEPDPENARRLQDNLTSNDVRADIQEVALSDAEATATLRLEETGEAGEGGNVLHAGSTDESDGTGRTVDVRMTRGDQLVDEDEVPQPTVLKVDVEGAELRVLEGLRETLADEQCRLVYCEVHPGLLSEQGRSPSELRETLEAAGFETERIGEQRYYLKGMKNQ